ncbi:unnamed protein product [Peronospora farinosa]|uniref:Uncharacterized protein n=1 Tax=Peronospora farinosa TaxID=134698 RepID=A0AAV0U5E4_9STRA|nr:unnamed protein product [Peronospora farinosa]
MARIPVILWPNESMTEYTQNFERWLESRKLSLALLRGNPAEERSLWHSFACTRAGTSELGEPRLRPRSQSLSQSSQRSSERSRSPLKSSNRESKEHSFRREYARSPDYHGESRSAGIQHPSSMINPPEIPRLYNNKTRRQLLERRVLLLEDYQKEVDQSPGGKAANANNSSLESLIPVPLYPRESMGHYDHRFWVWLREFGETKESLRSNPLRERRFRLTFASLRLNKPQVLTTKEDFPIETQTTVVPRSNIETHTKIPVGVSKTAREHVVMNGKMPANTANRQAHAMPNKPSCKRARMDAEGMTQVHVTPDLSSGHSTVCPEQKRKPALSLASSNPALPQSSSVLTMASSTKASLTATTDNTSSSAGPVCPSIFPQTAPERQTALAKAQTARSASILNERKQTKMRAKHRRIAPAQKTKIATSSNADASSTETGASRARDMATTAEPACLDKGLAMNIQAKFWDGRTPEPEPLTSKTGPAAPRSFPFPSASSIPPEFLDEPLPTTAAASIRAPRSADVSPATTTITKETPSVNVAENDSTDTDVAESEPDIARTESMAQEESEAESDPPDESEQHDGDVMNLEGCCCNKCMRSWAKMLANRMDQLEQNVLDLKRQVIG